MVAAELARDAREIRAAVPNGEAPPSAGRVTPLPLAVVERRSVEVIPPRPRWRRVLRRVRFVPLVAALVMLGGVIGLYFQPPGLRLVFRLFGLQPGAGTSTPIAVPVAPPPGKVGAGAAGVPVQRFVAGLGKLLPEGEVVTVAPPFGAGDARIAALEVGEGDRVERGAVLAVLDSERPFRAAIASARATVASREATLGQVKASVRASREEAHASLARAEATFQNAAREFERVDTLRQRGFAAEQAYDQRRTARDEAAREVERARATLSRYVSGEVDSQPDVLVAARNVDAAKADLARAEADLDKAYVRAPITGTILTIHARPGEKPGSKGVMTLGDLEHMKVEVEIYQTLIGRVALGDPVEVTADALPRPLKGSVTRIGLEVGRQSLVDPSPAANTDARVVKVTVTLEPESSRVAARFTNLQATVRIVPREEP